jgi:hypothetical protein
MVAIMICRAEVLEVRRSPSRPEPVVADPKADRGQSVGCLAVKPRDVDDVMPRPRVTAVPFEP